MPHAPGIVGGLVAPFRGFGYMMRRPMLWRYGVVPVVLNLLITALVVALLVWSAYAYVQHLHPRFAGGWWWRVVEVGVALGLLMAVAVGAGITWLALQAILCSYFYGRLARKVELSLGTPADTLVEVGFVHEAIDACRDVAELIRVNVLLLLLHVVPVVGSAVALAGGYYFTSALLGREMLSYPLGLRGLRRADRIAYTKRRRGATLGLGAVVLPLTLVPIVGAVLIVTAVVGAVLLVREMGDGAG